ncbi:hypothetical protein AB0I10_28220 [Streptomyces sp. NPDC050636]|uniref:hypothetical protein n=1 Tax=Streptomyces sp. NPDC050636 TaxID=3154510 RepID=UPI003413AC9D
MRRRTALTAGAAVVVAGAVAVPLSMDRTHGKSDEAVTAASAACVRSAAQEIASRRAAGYQPVSGRLRPGRIHVDDGATRSSGFRFEVDDMLAHGPVSSRGPITVWYPTSEVQLPAPGRYVLLLAAAPRPRTSGERLYDMAPEQVRRIGDDGKVRLDCGNGGERAVVPGQLRARIAAP